MEKTKYIFGWWWWGKRINQFEALLTLTHSYSHFLPSVNVALYMISLYEYTLSSFTDWRIGCDVCGSTFNQDRHKRGVFTLHTLHEFFMTSTKLPNISFLRCIHHIYISHASKYCWVHVCVHECCEANEKMFHNLLETMKDKKYYITEEYTGK